MVDIVNYMLYVRLLTILTLMFQDQEASNFRKEFIVVHRCYLSILSEAKTMGIFLPFGLEAPEWTWCVGTPAADAADEGVDFFGGRCEDIPPTDRLSEEVLLDASSNTEGKLVMEPARPVCAIEKKFVNTQVLVGAARRA